MPAIRATLNTSPLCVWPLRRIDQGRSFEKETVHAAVARRFVSGFSVICVMWTVLDGVRCGRSASEVVGRDGDGQEVFWFWPLGSVVERPLW